MTVIFQKGNEFWIEHIPVTISLVDAAGLITGVAVPLQKPGFFLGGSIVWTSVASNDNAAAVGAVEIRGLPTGSLSTLGTFVEQVRARIQKTLGTDGAATLNGICMVYLRGRASA